MGAQTKKDNIFYRIKYFIGVSLLLSTHISCTTTLILIIFALQGNIFSIIILCLAQVCLYFCHKSERAMDFINYFEGSKWFDHFEIITEEPIPENNCIFGFHPHNIFAVSLSMISCIKQSPLHNKGIPLVSRFLTHFGLQGIFTRLVGISGVDPANFKQLLYEKKNVILIPGGYEEATMTSTQEYRLYLKNRKGFIKYALQAGTKVCPIFSFGENKCYQTTDRFMKLRLFLNKIKLRGTLLWSRFGLIPEPNASIYVVVGKAIQLPRIPQPTQQQLDYYHKMYVQEVENLFYRHVDKCDPGAKLYMDKQL